MEQGLSKLCELCDIAQSLNANVRNSWIMIIIPNVACVAGVFTLGFGVGASVLTNTVAALANGVWQMRKVAHLEAERRHRLELELTSAGFETGAGLPDDAIIAAGPGVV